jgi:DNA (cytosine-5)-methyltransferase 1
VRVVGTFSGIGGLELGLTRAGMTSVAVAEIDPFANAVLRARLPGVENVGDITKLRELPSCDVLAAGFPCQDISQAGRLGGIHGERSGLIKYVLSAVGRMDRLPDFLLFENVPFLLKLNDGSGIRWLVDQIERLGYSWAYRVIDTQAFGLPQRRRRLFVLASRVEDPARILFDGNRVEHRPTYEEGQLAGFYWTEGNRGLGWAVDSVPPLKSTALVPSAPAIWRPGERLFVTPTIEDAEALQGFSRGWTRPAAEIKGGIAGRWRLVGNAVSVPAASWLGARLMKSPSIHRFETEELLEGQKWPNAAFGGPGKQPRKAEVGEYPGRKSRGSLLDFLSADAPTLSLRASAGFLSRLEKSRLRVPEQFRGDLRQFVRELTQSDNTGDQRANAKHPGKKQLVGANRT